jgi:hypothetical protein
VVLPVIQDQIAKHGFENNWWNELDQLPRRLNGLAAMCPKVLSQAVTRREPIGAGVIATDLFRRTDVWLSQELLLIR